MARAKFTGYCRACKGVINVGDSFVHQAENYNSHWDCDDPRGEVPVGARKAQLAQQPSVEQLISEQTAEQRALDRAEAATERRITRRENAEYAAGERDARRYQANRDLLGEDYAAAEEFAQELRDPAY